MNKIFFLNFLISNFILILISCNSNVNDGKSNVNYFKIKDAEFKNISEHKIENLDNKNGFKNIFLGTKLSSYNFNPEEWKINKEYSEKITEAICDLTSKDFNINEVKLQSIKLIFFEDVLILIDVNCVEQNTDDQNILKILTSIYGDHTDNLENLNSMFSIYDLYNYKSIFEYNKKVTSPIIKKSSVSSYPNSSYPITRTLTKDNETDEYYEYYNCTESSKGWEGKNIRLKYYFTSKTKGIYGKLKKDDGIPNSPKYNKIEANERFVIMSIKGTDEVLSFLKDYKIKESEDEIEKEEERKRLEYDKL